MKTSATRSPRHVGTALEQKISLVVDDSGSQYLGFIAAKRQAPGFDVSSRAEQTISVTEPLTVEGVEMAEPLLLRAQAIHPKVAMIAFNLACYASVTGRFEEAKIRLQHAIELDKDIRGIALDDEDLRPLWDWIAHLH